MTRGLEHVTIARDDELYEAFPDVCRLSGDRLLCTYRESDYHVGTTSQINAHRKQRPWPLLDQQTSPAFQTYHR